MKKLEFSVDSWHYKFVKWGSSYLEKDNQPDICGYTRGFLVASFMAFLVLTCIVTGIITILIPVMMGLGYLGMMVFHAQPHPKSGSLLEIVYMLGIVELSVALFVVVIFTIRRLIKDYNKRKRMLARLNPIIPRVLPPEPKPPKPPGIFKTMYKFWKQKTCVQLKFK